MRRVIIESPYAGDVARNLAYARRALRDSLLRGEAPLASHALYTQPGVLDDLDPADRATGLAAGRSWVAVADAVIVYDDYGISPGMRVSIQIVSALETPIEYRRIGANPEAT